MNIDKTKPIEDFTREEWQYILEKGAFRGKKINRAAKCMELNIFPIIYTSESEIMHVNKNIKINLNSIKRCPSNWTIGRLKYWCQKKILKKDQTQHHLRINNLADLIYSRLHASQCSSPSPDQANAKQDWKEYKERVRNFPDDPNFDRLKEMTSDDHYNKLNLTTFSSSHKELLAQALKIKEINSDTHYTFIHGQSLSYWVLNQFVKELVRISDPDRDLSCFHFFRSDIETKKVDAQEITQGYIWDGETYFRKKLLSVDAYYFDNAPSESANDFLSRNRNDWHGESEILEQIVNSYLGYSNPEIVAKLAELSSEYSKLADIGNIYTISIPKEKFDTIAFMAHPFGSPCNCENDPKDILERLQADEIPHKQCHRNPTVAQFRIVTDQLNRKNARITLITPVVKDIKDSYKSKIVEIAEETYALKTSKKSS